MELVKDVYSLHVRIAGLCERGGKFSIVRLPHKLVVKGGAPPPEAEDELVEAGLLRQIKKEARRKTPLFVDGCVSWKNAVRTLGLNHVQVISVSHSAKEYCLPKDGVVGLSQLGGTQSIDCRWMHLDRYIGTHINTRSADHSVNADLYMLMYSWLWRHNLSTAEKEQFRGTLGKLFKQM
jgi:hypothetical protein